MENALKRLVVLCFVAAGLAALLWPKGRSMSALLQEIERDFPDVRQISTGDLAARLERSEPGERPLLLDVRGEEEFRVSHLPEAKWAGSGAMTRDLIERFGKNQRAVLYCSVGHRASVMARNLQRAGWTNVAALKGSIFQWVIEERPLQSSAGPARVVHPFSQSYAALLPAQARAELPTAGLIANELPSIEKWRLGLGIALLLVFLTWESLAPAFEWFRKPRERLLHGCRNYALGMVNVVLIGLVFVQLWLSVSKWADTRQFGLFHWLDLPGWGRIAGALLFLDAWTYWWHRLNHRFGFLWRFHRTHHSEANLDITSAVRFHFGEMCLSALLRIPIIALLGLRFHELVIYETVLFSIVQFHHANIRLPRGVERVLGRVIVTPSFHRVHHAPDRERADSNYSSILTVWDRIFATRSNCPPPSRFGIAGMRKEPETLAGLVESPLD